MDHIHNYSPAGSNIWRLSFPDYGRDPGQTALVFRGILLGGGDYLLRQRRALPVAAGQLDAGGKVVPT
jgi:hypothetical protein